MIPQRMNLILFTEEELNSPLPLTDVRSRHILEVLGRSPGDPFDIGIVDGPRGKATIVSKDDTCLTLGYTLSDEPPKCFPITLLVGLSRPTAMRRVLRDVTSLGASRLYFFSSDRGEPGYAASALWRGKEYRRHLIDGAQQAFTTRLPEVRVFPALASSIDACLDNIPLGPAVALDNYEAEHSLTTHLRRHVQGRGTAALDTVPPWTTVAIGSERGWSPHEREVLRSRGMTLVHLGSRVLRTEVACLSAVSIVLSLLGFYEYDLISPHRSSQTSS